MMYVEVPTNTRYNNKEVVVMDENVYTWGSIVNVQEDHLDAHNYENFKMNFMSLIKENKRIVLSMEGVEFVDSAGLGAIMSMVRQLRAQGGELYICSPEKSVDMLFEMVRLHQVVKIFNTTKKAVKELENAI